MFFTYIWHSSGFTCTAAHERFSAVMSKQCELYGRGFGQAPTMKIKQLGDILIGQISYDPGVAGWNPWLDLGGTGIAWGGICEDYLGKEFDVPGAEAFRNLLDSNTGELLSWNGMFSVATWNEEEKRVVLTTAATECPTLWHTDGPLGWAAGPRAAPILELAGHKTEPNMDALSLYLLFGYFIGGHSPFRHVQRIRDRQQIIIRQNARPAFRTYASLQEYLATGWKGRDWKETVSFAVDRLSKRIDNQFRHSLSPIVLLTGGRDSRSIATAAKKSGHDFVTATGGPADSEDAVIAGRVAGILNVKHRLTGNGAPWNALPGCMQQIKTWVRMTEGMLPLNYSLHMEDFFESRLPFPYERVQYFHGLEPGIGRGSFYPNYPDVDVDKIRAMTLNDVHEFFTGTNKNPYLKLKTSTDELLQDICLRLDNDIRETGGGINHWFELLLWRERGLMWGMDLQSVNTPVRWAWAPLFDRELMALSWNLTISQKIEARLLLDASAAMQAALADVPCSQYRGGRRSGLPGRIKNRVMSLMRHYLEQAGIARPVDIRNGTDGALSVFWEAVLLKSGMNAWKEFIDEKDLLKIIRISPQNALLWRLATVNLLAGTFFNL